MILASLPLLMCLVHAVTGSEVNRPRGVSLSKRIFYDPRKDFSCLDGSGLLPFNQVNDDYCDCQDGSDEPGTAACTEGTFHCPNVGYVPKNIQSSRVNDGICDCCDASDEYRAGSPCVNTCLALGEESREARRKLLLLLRQGSEIREQYIGQAKDRLEQEAARLKDLKSQMQEAEAVKLEKEAVKRAAEQKEKQALAHYQAAEEARKQELEEQEFKKNEEKERLAAQQAFHDLDADQNGLLTFAELKSQPAFDQDADGVVSDDEAKFFLHMKEQMDAAEWQEIGWVIAKPYYLKSKQQEQQPTLDPVLHPEAPEIVTAAPGDRDEDQELDELESYGDKHDDNNVAPHDGHEEEEDEGEEEEDPAHQYSTPDHIPDPMPGRPSKPASAQEPEYDEETKALMEEAGKAKEEFQEAENKWQELERQAQQLEKTASTDFGPDHAFLPLYGQCFDLTDREYVYTLCPFDKAVQRPKDGGAETMLGRWGRWTEEGRSGGEAGHRYTRMRYEGGAACWNGPARSVDVHLSCGLENRVREASEPNRCEYRMHVETPALCLPQESLMADTSGAQQDHGASHEEL